MRWTFSAKPPLAVTTLASKLLIVALFFGLASCKKADQFKPDASTANNVKQEPDDTPSDSIKVEIKGTLVCKKVGPCYVAVTDKNEGEMRVWFWLSEGEWWYWRDIMEKLNGERVTVRGAIRQLTEGSLTSIPSRAMYFVNFEIETKSGEKFSLFIGEH